MPSTGSSATALSATTDVLSDEQMLTLLRRIQTEAQNRQFPVPGRNLTREQLHTLAVSPQQRATFLRRIGEQWSTGSGSDSDTSSGSNRGSNRDR